jgi:hypothetical protein
MDALGVKFNDVFAGDVPTLAKAEEDGMGSADLENYNILEVG